MDNWAVVDWTRDVWHFIVRMLIAIICGLAIGFERKSRSKEAGIRTHAIVCLASCMFMILSKYLTVPLFSDITGGTFNSDATRIAAQVVTGIGFLGAGIIMYRRDVMHGLTTAAGVWATSAIGMSIGGGFIVTGVVATAMILLLQLIFHLPIKAFTTRHIAIVKMQIWAENDEILPQIMQKLNAKKVSSYKAKLVGESLIATVEIATMEELNPNQFNSLMREFPKHLLSIERTDE